MFFNLKSYASNNTPQKIKNVAMHMCVKFLSCRVLETTIIDFQCPMVNIILVMFYSQNQFFVLSHSNYLLNHYSIYFSISKICNGHYTTILE
jgi:hypothetical protein